MLLPRLNSCYVFSWPSRRNDLFSLTIETHRITGWVFFLPVLLRLQQQNSFDAQARIDRQGYNFLRNYQIQVTAY